MIVVCATCPRYSLDLKIRLHHSHEILRTSRLFVEKAHFVGAAILQLLHGSIIETIGYIPQQILIFSLDVARIIDTIGYLPQQPLISSLGIASIIDTIGCFQQPDLSVGFAKSFGFFGPQFQSNR